MALDVPYGKNFKVQTLFHISPSTLTLPNGKQQTHVKVWHPFMKPALPLGILMERSSSGC
eukprot:scaffold666_cov332-Prasinococcus_capsulatus_cf.AAC.12